MVSRAEGIPSALNTLNEVWRTVVKKISIQARLAQLGERLVYTERVGGSIPSPSILGVNMVFKGIQDDIIDDVVIQNFYKKNMAGACRETKYGYIGCGFIVKIKNGNPVFIQRCDKSEDIKLSVKKRLKYIEVCVPVN